MSGAARPRTLAEALRALPATSLSRLLQDRDDLADPPPADLTELASRATTTSSVTRALARLDAWRRTVAEGLAALPDPAPTDALAALLDQPAALVAKAVEELRALGLVWGEADQLHLVRPAREAFEPFPGGLAPPSPRPLPDAQIDEALKAVRTRSPHRTGSAALVPHRKGAQRRPGRVAPGPSPVDELLALELLRPLDPETVILPREVAWGFWRPPRREPVATTPPPVTGRTRSRVLVDRAAAGAAFGLLDDLDLLVETLEPHRCPAAADRRAGHPRRPGAGSAPRHRSVPCDLSPGGAHAARLVGTRTAGLAPPPRVRRLATLSRLRGGDGSPRPGGRAPVLRPVDSAAGAHVLGPEADSRPRLDLRGAPCSLAATAAEPGTVVDRDALAAALAWHRPQFATPGRRRHGGRLDLAGGDVARVGRAGRHLLLRRAGDRRTDEPWPAELAELFPARWWRRSSSRPT